MPPVGLDTPQMFGTPCLDVPYVWTPPCMSGCPQYVWMPICLDIPCMFGHPHKFVCPLYVWMPPYVCTPPYVWMPSVHLDAPICLEYDKNKEAKQHHARLVEAQINKGCMSHWLTPGWAWQMDYWNNKNYQITNPKYIHQNLEGLHTLCLQ